MLRFSKIMKDLTLTDATAKRDRAHLVDAAGRKA